MPSPTALTSAWQLNPLTREFWAFGTLQSGSGLPPGVHGAPRLMHVQFDARPFEPNHGGLTASS